MPFSVFLHWLSWSPTWIIQDWLDFISFYSFSISLWLRWTNCIMVTCVYISSKSTYTRTQQGISVADISSYITAPPTHIYYLSLLVFISSTFLFCSDILGRLCMFVWVCSLLTNQAFRRQRCFVNLWQLRSCECVSIKKWLVFINIIT